MFLKLNLHFWDVKDVQVTIKDPVSQIYDMLDHDTFYED